MPAISVRRCGAAMAILILALLSACSKKEQAVGPAPAWGQTVRGKVTYLGQPVPYGYVLFFVHGQGLDARSGKVAPAATAVIQNGKYEASNVPTGPVSICVACDPEVNLAELIRPQNLGGDMPGGGPNSGGPPLPPQGGGMQGGPPMPPLPPMGGAQGGPPLPQPPMPPQGGGPVPPMPPANPELKLTDAQKKTLKEIHEKYATFGKSGVGYVVREGDQTFDIELK